MVWLMVVIVLFKLGLFYLLLDVVLQLLLVVVVLVFACVMFEHLCPLFLCELGVSVL